MRYLMTASLLSAWQFQFIKYFDISDEQATEQFMTALRREPIPKNQAMQNGLDFEQMACDMADGLDCSNYPNYRDWEPGAAAIAKIIRGGVWQYVASKKVTIGDIPFLLNGRLDVLKEDLIYDIKFGHNYKPGKFKTYPQHSMYLELIPYARQFEYLISDGRQVWTETYPREETPPVAAYVVPFMDWLAKNNLQKEYFRYWYAKE